VALPITGEWLTALQYMTQASNAYHPARGEAPVRTTLDIDDDVLEAAKSLARQSNRTAGAVLSELARRALTGTPPVSTPAGVGGFVPFESRGGVVTNEQIDRLREPDPSR
jgi:hypothetical protein